MEGSLSWISDEHASIHELHPDVNHELRVPWCGPEIQVRRQTGLSPLEVNFALLSYSLIGCLCFSISLSLSSSVLLFPFHSKETSI